MNHIHLGVNSKKMGDDSPNPPHLMIHLTVKVLVKALVPSLREKRGDQGFFIYTGIV
jgi:hypothetical protein